MITNSVSDSGEVYALRKDITGASTEAPRGAASVRGLTDEACKREA